MDLGLEGKVALVTGVSQGIGLACATSLLAEGAQVLGTSRSAPPTIAGLTHLQLDMTKSDAAERAVEETVARLGSLDILVNNVGSGRLSTGFADEARRALGGGHRAEPDDRDPHHPCGAPAPRRGWRRGRQRLERERAPSRHLHLCVQRRQGRDGQPHRRPLAGVRTPRRARRRRRPRSGQHAACGSAPTGVAATVAARTGSDPQTVVDQTIAEIPIGRFTTPEEVGDLVAFLASARAGTITGTTIRIDGGITPSV